MNGTLMAVKVKHPDRLSRQHKMQADGLRDLLMALVDDQGVPLYIHAGDGTFIIVWPKCSSCGCYNTVRRLRGGLCSACDVHSEDTS